MKQKNANVTVESKNKSKLKNKINNEKDDEEKKELTNYKNGNIQCVDRSILFC